MENSNSFLLKWNNYSSVLNFNFAAFFDKKKYTDVVLSAEGKFISAHKVVLAACSPYFENMFDISKEHPMIVINDVKFEDLEKLMFFAYHGEVLVNMDIFHRFITSAKMLQFKGVSQSDEFLSNTNTDTAHQLPPTPKSVATDPASPPIVESRKDELDPLTVVKPEILTMKTKPVEQVPDKKRGLKRRNAIFLPGSPLSDSKDGITPENAAKKKRVRKPKAESPTEDLTPRKSFGSPSSSVACEFCSNTYAKKYVSSHKASCKMNPDRKIFECPICNKQLSRGDKLAHHINVHKRRNTIAGSSSSVDN